MVSSDIEEITKKKNEIKEEFFSQTPERRNILNAVKDSRSDNNRENVNVPDEMKEELKEFYISKIGENNIKNSPDYDVELIRITNEGAIQDLNFPDSFTANFFKALGMDLVIYLFFGFLGGFAMGISNGWILYVLGLIFELIAWIGPIIVTVALFMALRDDEKLFKNSANKSESDIAKVSRLKFAPVLAFVAFLIAVYLIAQIAAQFVGL